MCTGAGQCGDAKGARKSKRSGFGAASVGHFVPAKRHRLTGAKTTSWCQCELVHFFFACHSAQKKEASNQNSL
jgi:hypothetical protein